MSNFLETSKLLGELKIKIFFLGIMGLKEYLTQQNFHFTTKNTQHKLLN
jgi:hypothetical protein